MTCYKSSCMNFHKCIHLHKPYPYQNIEQFHPQKVPLYLFPVNPSPPKKQTLFLLLPPLIVLLAVKLHIDGIIQKLLLWLFSFIKSLSFRHVGVCVSTLFLFIIKHYFIVQIYRSLSILQLTDSCFQF